MWMIYSLFHQMRTLKNVASTKGTYCFGNIVLRFAADYDGNLWRNIVSCQYFKSRLTKTYSRFRIGDRKCEKKANRELLGIQMINASNSDFRTAMMILIEYKGHRVIAFSTLPLDNAKTLLFSFGLTLPYRSGSVASSRSARCGSQFKKLYPF